MAVSMADITKLRKLTGAGMMDCKNALNDAEGDFDPSPPPAIGRTPAMFPVCCPRSRSRYLSTAPQGISPRFSLRPTP